MNDINTVKKDDLLEKGMRLIQEWLRKRKKGQITFWTDDNGRIKAVDYKSSLK